MKKIAEIKGVNGNLIVCEDCLVINRNNFSGILSGFKHKDRVKYYYYKDISHIDYRKPSIWGDGYFRINMPFSTENKEGKIGITGANLSMVKDPHTIVIDSTFFRKKSNEVHTIYKLIMSKMSKAKTSSNTVLNISKNNRLDDLKKLGDLKEMGVLTQEEFELEKQKILNN